ncbi:class I SAM-dependent methyltransferase [Pelagicoccus albus]|uniref:Amino acid adenylation domain-containing protein n=1 Tax=Pelagicoccus albus TaxID=415222 RepID=A0A7X1B9E9_9BACT|nr:class I SAM-dependent methyltransferase [Pelagicoccus albus]MBC2607982.1 amino acid adenylation domain-containing protein [Pelagicoccus albus]
MSAEQNAKPSGRDLSEAKRLLLQRRLKRKLAPQADSNSLGKRPADAPKLASIGQSRIWLLDRLDSGSASNNITSSFRIHSGLNVEALAKALEKVVSRHEILSSGYEMLEGQLTQVPARNDHKKLETFVCDSPDSSMQKAQAFGQLPIDIEKGPLYRVGLFPEPGGTFVLILTVHDIAFDKWSLLVFWKEVEAAYTHLAKGGPLNLEEPSYQFSDFAHWQRKWFTKERESKQADYWRAKLQDPPAPISLPTDHPYPATLTTAGSLEYGRIDSKTASNIKKLANENNASTFTVLILAFSLLLSKYSQNDDILVSTPVANRRKKETAKLIGFFLNTLVIRSNFAGNPIFLQALSEAKQTIAEALEHQDLPTDKIVELLKPKRVQGRHPLFQTMFVFQREDEGTPKLSLPGCEIEPIFIETKTSKFDISLFVSEQDDGFKTVVEYRTELFEAATIKRFLKHYETLLQGIAASPNLPVADLPYLSEKDVEELQTLEQGPALELTNRSTVLDFFAGRENSNTIALEGNGTSYSYAQLHTLSNRVAASLLEKGVTRGDSVALFLERSPEAIVAIYGILKAKCRYTSIDVDYPPKRVEQLFEDAAPALIICAESSSSKIPANKLTSLRIEELLANSDQAPADGKLTAPSLEDFAYTIFTSGSTGKPKGVSVTHGNLISSTQARLQYYDSLPKRFILIPSLSFDSSVASLFWTFAAGATLVVPTFEQIRDPELLSTFIAENRVDSLLAVPSLVEQLVRWNADRLTCLKNIIVAGEACSEKLVKEVQAKLPHSSLFNEYGPTEATVWATVHSFLRENTLEAVPIGKPIPGTTIRIVDSGRKRIPKGFVGEICIAGPGVTLGYDNSTELTQEKFFEDENQQRFYATGDLGSWNAAGEIVYHGRTDEQVKINGYRIEIGEIENALRNIEGVKEASVLATPSHLSPELDTRPLEELIAQTEEQDLAEAIKEVCATGRQPARTSKNNRRLKREKLEIELNFQSEQFIAPPRKAQRDWLIAQAINEIADDLEHLDKTTPQFVPGKDHKLDRDLLDITKADLESDSIMEDWQTPIMKQMAAYATESHGDILEIGFGLGVSASFIQDNKVSSHTVVEMNGPCIENHFKPWKSQYPISDIRLHHSRWQDILPKLGLFDGILFHAFPMNEEEFVEYVLNSVTFAEHAFEPMAAHLKKGGVFTYLTTEIDSISRRHQRALLKHFSEVTYRPISLNVPYDTIDTWWAQSMIAIKATK